MPNVDNVEDMAEWSGAEESKRQPAEGETIEVMLGSIVSRIKTDKEDIVDIMRHK